MALDFPATPAIGSKFTAPNGSTWQWDGVKWIAVAASAIVASGNVGRNLLDNSLFQILQRGAGPWSTSVYTADRWLLQLSLDTNSATIQVASDADRAAIGDEQALYYWQNVVTGNAGASAFSLVSQRIENLRRLSNKTVIISFWAKATSGTPKIGASIGQSFGTGGSPSASTATTAGAVTVGTIWTRYSMTVVVPSIAGKTFGSNGDDYTQVSLWLSSGSTNNAVAGNIGVQSGTFQIWGMQLEIQQPGQVQPTSLEKPNPQQDLARCQRFYQISQAYSLMTAGGANYYLSDSVTFGVQMRAAPTITSAGTAGGVVDTNITGGVIFDAATPFGCRAYSLAAATGNATWGRQIIAAADL